MISKNTQLWYRSVLCAVVLSGTACSPQDAADTSKDPSASSANAAGPAQPETPMKKPAPVADPGNQFSAAIGDLSGQTGIAADAISVTEARVVTWRSGALGCPDKGKSYTQAIVPGVLLLLEADGKTYRYHGTATGVPFHCPDGRSEAPALGVGDALM
jgi:hypothetical protein